MFKFPLQYLLLIWTCIGVTCGDVSAQEFPDIPNSLPFAGINVKLDAGARRIVESDVRSLMANRRFWEDKLDKAVLYFPIIEGVLIEEEVPIDFKYLAVQESSLAPDAVSSSNAVGFWQFKQETAHEFGIRVDNEIDERKSISASTHAAARYLKRSNKQFNNWVSSLYSYYLGMGGISQTVPPEWSYAREITLTARTDRYILRFFAHKIAFEAAFDRHRTANTIVLLESTHGKGRTFDDIAADLEINALDLRRYNRWVNGDQVPADKDYMIAIPVSSDQINRVRDKLALGRPDSEVEYAREDIGFPVLRKAGVQMKGRNDPVFYEINGLPGVQARSGDQAAALAKAAKISVSSFMRFNDMTSGDPVVAGEVYYLASKNKKAMVPFHTVRDGETLRGISQMYGLRLRDLMKYNRINNRNLRLQTGRVMWLMKKRPSRQPVEVVERPDPGKGPAKESRPAPVTSPVATASDIPQTAAERRKYTPKLADAPAPSEASPAATSPGRVSTSQPASNQGSTGSARTNPAGTTLSGTVKSESTEPTGVYQPSRTETATTGASKSTSPNSNDRVVIISEEDNRPYNTRSDASRTAESRTSESRPVEVRTGSASSSPANDTWTSDESTSRARSDGSRTGESRTGGSRTIEPRPAASRASESRPSESRSLSGFHSVQAGQTYFSISKLYDITIDELLSWNNLTTQDKLAVGQRLLVKAPAAATPVRSTPSGNDYEYHTVIAGETLFRISQNYNASIEEIKRLNNMSDNTVKLGQKIKVPKR